MSNTRARRKADNRQHLATPHCLTAHGGHTAQEDSDKRKNSTRNNRKAKRHPADIKTDDSRMALRYCIGGEYRYQPIAIEECGDISSRRYLDFLPTS